MIQLKYGDALQKIVNTEGYLKLRKIEEEVICSREYRSSVIATGGSAVYSDKAMSYLKEQSIAVFLNVSFDEIKKLLKYI